MNENAVLLHFVDRNARSGADTIRQLLHRVEDKELKGQLKTQFQGYEGFHETAERMLREGGYGGADQDADTRPAYLAMDMQAMTDTSSSHIAELFIGGSSTGVVEAIKRRNECEDAALEIRNLVEKLQKFEEHNIEKLKEFL